MLPRMPDGYPTRIRKLHRRLGIEPNYSRVRQIPLQREARQLVSIGPAADDGRPVRLTPAAAKAWQRLRDAAARDGLELLPLSGFRSVVRQAQIIRGKLAEGQTLPEILCRVAAPGHPGAPHRHDTGTGFPPWLFK